MDESRAACEDTKSNHLQHSPPLTEMFGWRRCDVLRISFARALIAAFDSFLGSFSFSGWRKKKRKLSEDVATVDAATRISLLRRRHDYSGFSYTERHVSSSHLK